VGWCYAKFSGSDVPPNIEFDLSLSFSLSGQQCTIHLRHCRGIIYIVIMTRDCRTGVGGFWVESESNS